MPTSLPLFGVDEFTNQLFFGFHDAMDQNIPQTNTTTAETSEFLGDNTRFIFVSKWPYAL